MWINRFEYEPTKKGIYTCLVHNKPIGLKEEKVEFNGTEFSNISVEYWKANKSTYSKIKDDVLNDELEEAIYLHENIIEYVSN